MALNFKLNPTALTSLAGICDGLSSLLLSRFLSTQVPALRLTDVVPAHILQEQALIEAHLAKASDPDGRKRLNLTLEKLPSQTLIPQHQIEDTLPTYQAFVRGEVGKIAAKWLRRAGRTPARIYSLPQQGELFVHLLEKDATNMVRTYGRHGCCSRAFRLEIVHPQHPKQVLAEVRVKPEHVGICATTLAVQDIDLLYCPQEREVKVSVPIRLANEDAAPGVKKGAWMFVSKRTVRCLALGKAIPPFLEVNVRALNVGDSIRVCDLNLPTGVRHFEQDLQAVVVECTTDVGKD